MLLKFLLVMVGGEAIACLLVLALAILADRLDRRIREAFAGDLRGTPLTAEAERAPITLEPADGASHRIADLAA